MQEYYFKHYSSNLWVGNYKKLIQAGTYWYSNPECTILHRDGAPAIEYTDGVTRKVWYQHGELHRDGGPAVEYSNGSKTWYQHGELHRDGGPAYEGSGDYNAWYRNGKRHRIGGPAIVSLRGIEFRCDDEWWIDGHQVTEEHHAKTAQLAARYSGAIAHVQLRISVPV